MRRLLLPLLVALTAGAAFAHAELRESEPAADSVVTEAPVSVTLRFSEPLESLFSVFKVYPLNAEVNVSEEGAHARLNGLAAALVNEVLELRDDAEEMVPTQLRTEKATTDELELQFDSPLAPGHYVVMWRVLSIDTHVTQGFFVFTVSE